MKSLGEFISELQHKVAPDSPEDQEAISSLVRRIAKFQARKLSGEDGIDDELAHLRSQAMNLAREQRNVIVHELEAWLTSTVGSLLYKVLPPT